MRPGNAEELLKQWSSLHGLPESPARSERIHGHRRDVWVAADGTEAIESFTIAGMPHGLPLAIAGVEEPHGEAGPFMLDVGIASSSVIARFWGILADAPAPSRSRAEDRHDAAVEPSLDRAGTPDPDPPWELPPHMGPRLRDVGSVIHKALRSAGLMR